MTAWRDRAACAGHPPEWWYTAPSSGRLPAHNLRALDICQACPVLAECHDDVEAAGPRLRSAMIVGGTPYNLTGRPRTIDGSAATAWRPGVVHPRRPVQPVPPPGAPMAWHTEATV